MSVYVQLLDAAIRDLEARKNNGERFVAVAPETLGALASPVLRARRAEPAMTLPKAIVPATPVSPPAAASPRVPLFPAVQPPPPTLTSIARGDRSAEFAELRARVLACAKCPHLVTTRKSVVFGVGDPNAQLMFVGEAPGVDEDRQGEPFVGAAGQLLTKIITTMGQTRQTVYIANVLKCRPPENRDPRPEEVSECLPYLHRQVALLRPQIILAFGRVAAQNLLGTDSTLGKLRGTVHRFGALNTPVVVTYHPAYLLRSPGEKRKAWEDLKFARRVFADLPPAV